jgi:hypothetical protein
MPLQRAIGLVVLIVAGVLAGRSLAPKPAPERVVRAGVATLTVPDDRIAVAFGPPVDATLVPRAMRDRASGTRRPARLGGYGAWSYGEVTVLPTSRGVLACAGCAARVRTVTVPGASILTPTPDLAFALRLRPALDALEASRTRVRATLRRAEGQAARSRLATALAHAHEGTAVELTPLAGPRGRALVDRLRESARAYEAFARSAAARGRVDAADSRLASAVAKLKLESAVQSPARTTPPTTRHWAAAILWLLVALAGALLALGPRAGRLTGARRHRVGGAAAAPQFGVAPRPRRVAATPERPHPGPRWDAAPRAHGTSPLSALGEQPPPTPPA